MINDITLGEWLPDLPYYANPGLVEAKNTIPVDRAYKDYLALQTSDDAMPLTVVGAFAARDTSNDSYIYSATSKNIFKKVGTAWTTANAVTYNTAASDYWRFTQFDNLVIATNYSDTVQAVTAGATTISALSVSTTVSKARQIGVINRFLMLGDTNDGAGVIPHRVRWSAIDNPADFPVLGTQDARSKQSSAQVLPSIYGPVTFIANGDYYGLVFQSFAVTRFTYVGGDTVFQVQTYERTRGAFFPQSVVQVGNLCYFWAADGCYVTDGSLVTPIGNGKVDKYFLSDCDKAYKERVMGAIDYINKCVVWCYASSSATTGRPNRLIIYNWAENRWARAEDEMEILFSSISQGYTLDQLDSLFTSIDDMTISLDSPVWQGGINTMMAFDSTHKMGTFTGDSATARYETGELDINPPGTGYIDGVRPLVTGTPSTVEVSIGVRSNQDNESRSFGVATQRTTRTGMCDFRSSGKYLSVRMDISGGFDRAIGVKVNGQPDDGV